MSSSAVPRLIINGEQIDGESRETLPLIDPATARQIGTVPVATSSDVVAALDAASAAFDPWARTPPGGRALVLERASQLLRERRSLIAATLTLEQGKVLVEAEGEVDVSADLFSWFAAEAARIHDRVSQSTNPEIELRVLRVPVGPTAILTPWNFPLIEPAAHAAAALAAGCPVILKVSEETPLTGALLVEVLLDAGLPPGAAQLLIGDPRMIADSLIRSPIIRKVAFTGSVQVGKELAAKAAAELKPSTMELGGNAAAIVLADADLEDAARQIAAAKCRNAGQVCTAPNRIFVQREILGDFVDAYTAFIRDKQLGAGADPSTDMGPLINLRRLSAIDDLVRDARERGVSVSTGGHRTEDGGFFYENTVLVDPPEDSRVAREEIFGPISPIFGFSTLEEALRRANNTNLGLAGYVFTNEPGRAQRAARAINAGSVAVNHTRAMFAEAPFGGIKDSGYGRIGGPEGLDGYLLTRVISTYGASESR